MLRWFWRTVLGSGAFDERTLRRRGIDAVGEDSGDEEESVQQLLRLVRRERPRPYELPDSFDARADDSRLAMLALAHLGPLDLATGEPIDVAGMLEKEDKGAFAKILKQLGSKDSRSPANRLIQRKGTQVERLLRQRIAPLDLGDRVLASHAIDREAAELLVEKSDPEGFLRHRAALLTEVVRRFVEGRAAWDHNDRPSVEHLLEVAGVSE